MGLGEGELYKGLRMEGENRGDQKGAILRPERASGPWERKTPPVGRASLVSKGLAPTPAKMTATVY